MHSQNVIKTFWTMVDKKGPADCWPWIGGLFKSGYSKFNYLDEEIGEMVYYTGYWFTTELKLGRRIKKGCVVRNLCGDVSCVNPDHWREDVKGSEHRKHSTTKAKPKLIKRKVSKPIMARDTWRK